VIYTDIFAFLQHDCLFKGVENDTKAVGLLSRKKQHPRVLLFVFIYKSLKLKCFFIFSPQGKALVV
ncbi:hypothetical protein BZG22_00005, partial [Salinivibrio sp. IB870]|uniref:hypothetical protein n=1 Tax=Salinivibrio sp. IB870 TaxID=1766121 RepID=UPI0009CE9FA6